MMAWVDPNTLKYASSIDADADDQWCDVCQEHVWFCSLEEFGDNLDAWWLAVDFPKMERITGLSAANYPADVGGQAFLDACNAWWKTLDYERKRTIWMENDQSRTAQRRRERRLLIVEPYPEIGIVGQGYHGPFPLPEEVQQLFPSSLCHYAFTTRMIDQEIMYLRVRTIVCVGNATASERSTALVIGLIYQRNRLYIHPVACLCIRAESSYRWQGRHSNLNNHPRCTSLMAS